MSGGGPGGLGGGRGIGGPGLGGRMGRGMKMMGGPLGGMVMGGPGATGVKGGPVVDSQAVVVPGLGAVVSGAVVPAPGQPKPSIARAEYPPIYVTPSATRTRTSAPNCRGDRLMWANAPATRPSYARCLDIASAPTEIITAAISSGATPLWRSASSARQSRDNKDLTHALESGRERFTKPIAAANSA